MPSTQHLIDGAAPRRHHAPGSLIDTVANDRRPSDSYEPDEDVAHACSYRLAGV
jgi:hypothetical protein